MGIVVFAVKIYNLNKQQPAHEGNDNLQKGEENGRK